MTTKHSWLLDSDGEIDVFALDYEYHNGPYCTECCEAFCKHCTPDWATTICEGDEDE